MVECRMFFKSAEAPFCTGDSNWCSQKNSEANAKVLIDMKTVLTYIV